MRRLARIRGWADILSTVERRFRDVEGRLVVVPTDGGAPLARLRYCWGGSPACNRWDGSGLPVGPFELALAAPAPKP